jgi:AhpD family alkylhydroperoxidase
MQRFTVPSKEGLSHPNRLIFDKLEQGLGMVPNLYAYFGHSESALANYLAFQQGQSKGVFNAREREAVFLAVSEVNGCHYCKSAHAYLGKLNGFSEEEVINIRLGNASDPKIRAITALASEIQETHGRPTEETLHNFFQLGYSQGALVDLVSLVADKVFANYIHNITKIPIDFPLAPELEETVTLH